MISAHNICKSFGGIRAVDDCSLTVERGQILGLIGPNGAGKTTLFNILAGFMRPDSGRIELDGETVTGERPHELFRRGLVRTFQIAHELARMTVLENLMVVPAAQSGERLLTAWFRPGLVRRRSARCASAPRRCWRGCSSPTLRFELAGNLSGGQKKLLELGRAMMTDAKVVLLDEIGAGVNRSLMAELAGYIEALNRDPGYSFCIIEHDMDLIARLCDPVVVMAEGRILARGSMAEIRAKSAVVDAYLGGRMAHERARAGDPLLDATGLVGGYGGMDILNGVDIAVDSGEIVVIVGPNGAGKSTAMKAIIGLLPLKSGRVTYAGQEITGEAPEHLAARGIAYVPQERNVFRTLRWKRILPWAAIAGAAISAPAIARIYAAVSRA